MSGVYNSFPGTRDMYLYMYVTFDFEVSTPLSVLESVPKGLWSDMKAHSNR